MDNCEIQITNKNLVRAKHKNEHEPYEYYKYQMTKEGKDEQCSAAVYEIPPLKANYPYHYHLKNEEVFYIVSGNGILETKDGNKIIAAGDIIICPPSEKAAHKIINTSKTEKLVYFECDTADYPDVAYYPKSNKIGILNKETNLFFKNNAETDYYEGE